jgi:hypothetical protein
MFRNLGTIFLILNQKNKPKMKICYLDDVPSNNFVFEATIKRIDKCNLPDIDIELD